MPLEAIREAALNNNNIFVFQWDVALSTDVVVRGVKEQSKSDNIKFRGFELPLKQSHKITDFHYNTTT